MVQKLVNLAALLSVALVACTFGAQPASALTVHGSHAHLNRAEHHAMAVKKQRRSDASSSKRCRKRPSSSASLAHPTSSAVFSSTQAASTATSEAVSTTEVHSSTETHSSSEVHSYSHKKTSTTSEVAPTTSQVHTSTQAPPPPPPPSSTHSSTHSDAPTSTSSAVATSSPKPPPSGGSKKVGLSWPAGQTGLNGWVTGNVGWVYSWRAEIDPEAFNYDVNMIPMLWGPTYASDFVANAEKNVKGNWMAFLNEPNEVGQSNISPQDASTLYWSSMKQFQDKGYDIIAPATSSDPDGFTWVQTFFNTCGPDCKFSALALHYYDTSADRFIQYIEKWHAEWPELPIFVTEFACQNFVGGAQCSMDETWAFWSEAIKYMEAQPWLYGYFGFGSMRDMAGVNADNQLMNPSTGNPTSLGDVYLAASWS